MGASASTSKGKQHHSDAFEFTSENLKKAKEIIAKYPEGKQRSALLPLLDLAQRQHDNWLSVPVMDYVAGVLDLAPIKVYEVASFYTMFHLQPVGKNLIQLCRTTPCWLRGSEDIAHACKKRLGIDLGETTKDDNFTLIEVECLGACVNAPVVQINDDFFEDLDAESMERIIDHIEAGKEVIVGSQIGRQCSAPEGETRVKKKKS